MLKKTKYIIFHAINKNIEGVIPELRITGTTVDRVHNFNFLGLYPNEHLFWKPHIDIVANKLIKFSGVINKLKIFLPIHILRTLYFSMVQWRLTYGILAWGFEYQRFIKLQKRFLRNISLSNYNAHTEPIFKRLEIITIKNLCDLNCLKFVYNYKKGELPDHFLKFRYAQRASIHNHETRFSSLIDKLEHCYMFPKFPCTCSHQNHPVKSEILHLDYTWYCKTNAREIWFRNQQ